MSTLATISLLSSLTSLMHQVMIFPVGSLKEGHLIRFLSIRLYHLLSTKIHLFSIGSLHLENLVDNCQAQKSKENGDLKIVEQMKLLLDFEESVV